MVYLVWGLAIGCAASLGLAALIGAAGYRRMARLAARAKQAERLAELGTLTGGLAHEIKNPLSTVQLNLQLLAEDLDASDPAQARLRHRLQICERETTRLRDILDDFLRYAGKMELERKEVDLNPLCQDLVDFFYPQAQLQRVQLRFKPADEKVIVQADERLLKQALLNLMLNAVQAMPCGGELILRVSNNAQEAAVDVIDTGGGIAPETVNRIFDAYYSTKKGGTGLGLAMTQRIAAEHGGRVTVSSEVGKGSDFSLRLPLE